jgi:hypothetical protein
VTRASMFTLGAMSGFGFLSQALGPAKDKKYALKSLDGCIVSGCWEPKRKFQFRRSVTLLATEKTIAQSGEIS